MIEVREMSDKGIEELVRRIDYGHLACSLNDQPYVVPIHFAYDGKDFFIFTTDGKKSHILDKNPRVCLQIEDVKDNQHWQSVIVTGEARKLTVEKAIEKARETIVKANPTLTPAISIHWMDNWVRENIEVIYAIRPIDMTGRESVVLNEID